MALLPVWAPHQIGTAARLTPVSGNPSRFGIVGGAGPAGGVQRAAWCAGDGSAGAWHGRALEISW